MIIIAFEGLDGVGKTTLIVAINRLVNCIVSQEFPKASATSEYKEVSDYIAIGAQYREMLINAKEMDRLMIISDCRRVHSQMVLQPLHKQNIIIMDRYIESTYAYQGLDFSEEFIQNLENYIWNVPAPDLNILVTGARKKRSDDDNIDQMTDIVRRRIQQNYLHRKAQNPDKWYEVEVNDSPEKLAAEVYKKMQLLIF